MTDKDKTERFRCSEKEKALIESAAKAMDLNKSAWIRATLLQRAREIMAAKKKDERK